MTLRNHVHSFFHGVHGRGRYRIFTGLKWHVGPLPKWTSTKRRQLGVGHIAAIAAAALSFHPEPLANRHVRRREVRRTKRRDWPPSNHVPFPKRSGSVGPA
jgi:hypothetical protein